jgi:hypothetical protein
LKYTTTSLLFILSVITATAASAGPADYVYMPGVVYSEKEIDYKFGSARNPDGTSIQVSSLGYGVGASESWFSEIYLKSERDNGSELTLGEWENKFQLTETGKYPVDTGFIIEIEVPLNDNDAPYEVRLGPLFQTDFDRLQVNGNLLFERKFARGGPYVTEFGYQLQAKYRLRRTFEFGAQALGETGEWNNWDNRASQNHRIGPAVFGRISLSHQRSVKYNAAWLLGASDAAPDHTFRMQVEYEYY